MEGYKTLIRKIDGEWAVYKDGFIWTSNTPTILASSATIELLKDYHKKQLGDKPDVICWNNYEIINVTITREFGDLKSVRCKFGCKLKDGIWYAENGHRCASQGGINCNG